MIKGYQIVAQIQEAFPKISTKLASLTGKTYETFSSHGREAKTQNPNSSGNVSPIDHALKYIRLHEASEKGAGLMMSRRLATELELEFTGVECKKSTKEMLDEVLTESADVLKMLNNCDMSKWTAADYAYAETQCDELSETALLCKAKFRAMRKESESRKLKAVA